MRYISVLSNGPFFPGWSVTQAFHPTGGNTGGEWTDSVNHATPKNIIINQKVRFAEKRTYFYAPKRKTRKHTQHQQK